MSVALINYGMGNLGSVRRSLEELGARVDVVDSPRHMREASALILPGVGAFGAAMRRLTEDGWVDELRYQVVGEKKALLGICLGMQLLADGSDESADVPGLGFVPGRVSHLGALGCEMRIPHMGWNDVEVRRDDGLLRDVPQHVDFYFVHSFALVPLDEKIVTGVCRYGVPIAAVIESGNVYGTQFHPEKSARAGRQVLSNFLAMAEC